MQSQRLPAAADESLGRGTGWDITDPRRVGYVCLPTRDGSAMLLGSTAESLVMPRRRSIFIFKFRLDRQSAFFFLANVIVLKLVGVAG